MSKRVKPAKPIQEQLRDTALQLMDDLRWDPKGRVPALMWSAAAHIDRLEGKPSPSSHDPFTLEQSGEK